MSMKTGLFSLSVTNQKKTSRCESSAVNVACTQFARTFPLSFETWKSPDKVTLNKFVFSIWKTCQFSVMMSNRFSQNNSSRDTFQPCHFGQVEQLTSYYVAWQHPLLPPVNQQQFLMAYYAMLICSMLYCRSTAINGSCNGLIRVLMRVT